MLIIWLDGQSGGEVFFLFKTSDPLQHILERLLPLTNQQLVVEVLLIHLANLAFYTIFFMSIMSSSSFFQGSPAELRSFSSLSDEGCAI